MKIKRITVEWDLDADDLSNHATTSTYENGLWSHNGPIYSRVGGILHSLWQSVRRTMNEKTNTI